MVNKLSLSKKLASYSVMATALLAVEKPSDAQIVYHEVTPAFTIAKPPGDYFLDLNGDGTNDFHFTCFVTFFTSNSANDVELYALNSNRFNATPQQSLATINLTSVYRSFSSLGELGWYNTSDKYMPLKLVSGGNTYMGWARLSITVPDTAFTIKDYAYDLTPTDSIIMGDMGCAYKPITPVISLKGSDTLTSTSSHSYEWYSNGVLLTSDTSQTIVTSQHGTYSVITTDTGGCKTQSGAVNFMPCDSARIMISTVISTTSCGSVYPVLELDTIPYAYTKQWYRNDTAVTLHQETSFGEYKDYNDSNKTYSANYYIIAHNPFTGCNDTSNTIQFTVNPFPPTPALIQQQDTILTTVKGNYIYAWYDTSQIAGADTNYYVPATEYSMQYSLTLTDSLTGCESSSNIYFNGCYFISSSIKGQGSALGCSVDSITLHAFAGSGLVYSWSIDTADNPFPQTIVGANDSVYTATKAGTYSITIDDSTRGCDVSSNYIITAATDPATPPVFKENDTLLTGVYNSYQWYINGDSIPGATAIYYVTDTASSYTVKVTNEAGCSATSDSVLIEPTGIVSLASDEPIKVYTNADVIYINFLTPDFLNGIIDLYNIEGQKLQEKTVTGNLESLNGQQLAKGMYFVTITKNEVRRTYKVVLL